MTLTFSEVIDPESVLAGWTGAATNVVVRITNAGGGDVVTIRNAANTAQLPLGSVDLTGTQYVTADRDFGATGTASIDGPERRLDHDHPRHAVGRDRDAGPDRRR